MTNETTASQPKSIGDDAQFLALMKKYFSASNWGADQILPEIVKLIDSRAPAVQVSAFLSLADDDGFRLALSKYNVGELTEKDFIEFLDGHAKQAAQASATIQAAPIYQRREEGGSWTDTTLLGKQAWDEAGWPTRIVVAIQEPVMVAEPVGVEKLRAALVAAKGLFDECSMTKGPIIAMVDAALAAPMVADPAGVPVSTLGEVFASVGGWMNGGELGYPSFGSMDALRVFTERSIRAALAATVKAVPSEALELAGMVVKATFGEHKILVPRVDLSGKEIGTLVYFAAPLAEKTGGGEL